MSDYVYFRVAPKSPADVIIDTQFASSKAIYEWAEAFGKRWLGDIPFKLYGTEDSVVGFTSDGMWGDFHKALRKAEISYTEDAKSGRCCVRPRSASKKDKVLHALKEEWDRRPKGRSWEWVAQELFGMARFCFGMRMSSMYASWYEDVRIVGCPWLATRGYMEALGPGEFALCEGLVPLPYEEAMMLVYKKEMADADAKRAERAAKAAKKQELKPGESEDLFQE